MKFDKQHIIITGGSSGIGKATAQILASKGAHISLIARNIDKLETAQAEIETARVHPEQRIQSISADVANRNQIEQAIAKAIKQIGLPDMLIACAGSAHPGYFLELPIEVFEQTMAINYFGTLYTIRAVLPAMIQRRRGHIVLISSGAGIIGIYGYTPYSPSKFAIRGLAESLRGELKPVGVRVSVVYPPDTETPQLEAENKTKPVETKLITSSAETWSAEGVARMIVRGIYRGEFAITPGWEMTLLARLHSLLAPALNWYFDHLVTKIPH
ncbi:MULTISPECIES: SDR family oxidoreductase [unclassified Nostoc]|uniref:SDR family oxidoreductase n=1 Tax=unclassified Nostoc TaxID=2593658 RepID=UPI002AD3E2CB|nr:SDR family oxidoreductase [Nostoc sp. DedQUE03]MDZ7975568.1 SDR family oxidoreductase [Nostoc sp. DedQUE03]MDZ8048787.1 SDR family oxidoreductase [Nostoc sp. DedQUE02]